MYRYHSCLELSEGGVTTIFPLFSVLCSQNIDLMKEEDWLYFGIVLPRLSQTLLEKLMSLCLLSYRSFLYLYNLQQFLWNKLKLFFISQRRLSTESGVFSSLRGSSCVLSPTSWRLNRLRQSTFFRQKVLPSSLVMKESRAHSTILLETLWQKMNSLQAKYISIQSYWSFMLLIKSCSMFYSVSFFEYQLPTQCSAILKFFFLISFSLKYLTFFTYELSSWPYMTGNTCRYSMLEKSNSFLEILANMEVISL